MAADGGTEVLFATPHIESVGRRDCATQIAGRVVFLQSELDGRGVSLRLVAGAEVYPSDDVLCALDSGSPLTLGPDGRYILLDLPLTAIPLGFEHLIFGLQTRGLTPILAHPERSQPVQMEPRIIEPLVERGVLLQINAASLLGGHGPCVEAAAAVLLEHNWVHFVASDAHSTRHRRPRLAEAARMLVDLIGEDKTRELTEENGRLVLEGGVVSTNPLAYSPKRAGRGWLRTLIGGGRNV